MGIIFVGSCDYTGRQEGQRQRCGNRNRDEKEGKKEKFKDAMLLTLKMEEEATH